MQTAIDPNNQSPQENTNHLHIEFFSETVEDVLRTRAEGKPCFKDEELVRIRYAGDKNSVLVAPANVRTFYIKEPGGPGRLLSYAERFPRHYEAFKANQVYIGDGTPLTQVTFLTAARVRELAMSSVHTVEALAGLDGTMLQRLGMDARELKNKAQAYLDSTQGSAGLMKLASENAEMQTHLEQLRSQIAELMAAKQPVEVAKVSADKYPGYSDEDLKNIIKDKTGQAPRGVPKRETLVAMLDEAVAKESEAAA
jgi:hypothetical protein